MSASRNIDEALKALDRTGDDRPEEIIKLAQEILPRLRNDESPAVKARVWYRLGLAHLAVSSYEASLRALTEARRLHEEIGDRECSLSDLQAFGILYTFNEQYDQAIETFMTVRQEARDLGFRKIEEAACCNIGRTCFAMGRFDEAREFLEDGLRIVSETGHRLHEAAIIHELGKIDRERRALESARQRFERAASIVRAEKSAYLYEYLCSLGNIYTELDRPDDAGAVLKESLDLSRTQKLRNGEMETLYALGSHHAAAGDHREARHAWNECAEIASDLGNRRYSILCGEGLAELSREEGDLEAALSYLEQIRAEENAAFNDRIYRAVSSYDQWLRIHDLEREKEIWRRRTGELEKAREEQEDWIRELETIRGIGQEITASLQPDRIIDILHDRIVQLMSVDSLMIALYDEENEKIDARYIIEEGERLGSREIPLLPDKSLAAWAILHDRDLLINDKDREGKLYADEILHMEGTKIESQSFIFVLLKMAGSIIGLVSVQSRKKDSYRTRHLKIIQTLAGFIAVSLSNSLIHQDLLKAHEQIEQMATHDALTGLPNRVRIIETLGEALFRAFRYRQTLAVLFIDLDGFKDINDNFGHHAGDSFLVETAERLRNGIRATDAAGRLAGDEFLVILTDDCGPAESSVLAGKIREALAREVDHESRVLRVTASVGIAHYPDDGETPEELIRAADGAMYVAKATGKNRTVTAGNPEER